jgi:hypothetical protein
MSTCNHACEINYNTLHPQAEHYLDCPAWEAVTAASSLSAAGVIPTRQRRASGAARYRGAVLRAAVGVGLVVCYSGIILVGIVLFGAVFFGWR